MHKFSRFDLTLNIGRLPLTYSLGDLSSIREIFTPENGDIWRTQLPILPALSETRPQEGQEPTTGAYLVEMSPALIVAIREFLKEVVLQLEWKTQSGKPQRSDLIRKYVDIRRECMNRIGIRLIEVIKQERRLGLYNLFWLTVSKHLVTLFDRVIPAKGRKKIMYQIAMLPIIAQTFQETIEQVTRYLQKDDTQKRRYSKYIDDTRLSHLGAAFNYEFSRAIITDQIHLICPCCSRYNLMECAQMIFLEENEKYHITYDEFMTIYSGVRTYIEKRLQSKDTAFYEMIASALRIPAQTVLSIPREAILFHPTIISLFAEEIKQLPVKNSARKKSLFKSWVPQLGDIFGEGSWEFAMNDYFTFAKDLRRSEIINYLRDQIVFTTKTHRPSVERIEGELPHRDLLTPIADKISYQFDKGRIINDLRKVTLVFLDIRGFTELSAGDIRDQELKDQLYKLFDPMVNIINHFEGTIKTYAGDGILASFGTPTTHAINALRAAIEIQKFFRLLKKAGKISFKGMGIGVHSGLVEETYFFPDLEAPSHNTVIGLTANLAGRLSSGKTEKAPTLDIQALHSLKDYVCSHLHASSITPATVAMVEDRFSLAFETLQAHQEPPQPTTRNQNLTVNVTAGVLNNNGIAISNATFKHLHAQNLLQEVEARGDIQYTFFDKILKEQILLIKSGDARFKGIKGKFPVWGVYLSQKSSSQNPPRIAAHELC